MPVAELQIRLLREVLEWGEIIQKSMDADDYAAMKRPAKADKMSQKWTLKGKDKKDKKDKKSDDFVVLVFPEGDFQVVPEGTTAADIIDQKVGLCYVYEHWYICITSSFTYPVSGLCLQQDCDGYEIARSLWLGNSLLAFSSLR